MKYLADIKSTFDSIVFEWDETKSNIQNVYDFTDVFLKITDPYNKISTRVSEHTMRTIKIAERILNKEIADKEIVIILAKITSPLSTPVVQSLTKLTSPKNKAKS